jgi:hypothetical protein
MVVPSSHIENDTKNENKWMDETVRVQRGLLEPRPAARDPKRVLERRVLFGRGQAPRVVGADRERVRKLLL